MAFGVVALWLAKWRFGVMSPEHSHQATIEFSRTQQFEILVRSSLAVNLSRIPITDVNEQNRMRAQPCRAAPGSGRFSAEPSSGLLVGPNDFIFYQQTGPILDCIKSGRELCFHNILIECQFYVQKIRKFLYSLEQSEYIEEVFYQVFGKLLKFSFSCSNCSLQYSFEIYNS